VKGGERDLGVRERVSREREKEIIKYNTGEGRCRDAPGGLEKGRLEVHALVDGAGVQKGYCRNEMHTLAPGINEPGGRYRIGTAPSISGASLHLNEEF